MSILRLSHVEIRVPDLELATAYYYGARLMRLAGKPADEWREVAGRARQNFRYLAEDGWQDAFASDEAGAFPVGIEVSVWFDRGASADFADPADSAATRPDRRRFFRCMGGPKVDPLAIRSIESEVTR